MKHDEIKGRVEEDGDEVITAIPNSCQRFACKEHHPKLENRNGFMVCPRCHVSYGAAPAASEPNVSKPNDGEGLPPRMCSTAPVACDGCGERFMAWDKIYRCVDCDGEYHKHCIKKHWQRSQNEWIANVITAIEQGRTSDATAILVWHLTLDQCMPSNTQITQTKQMPKYTND